MLSSQEKLKEIGKELKSHATMRAGLIEKARAVMSEFDTYNSPDEFAVGFALEEFGLWVQLIEVAQIVDELNTDVYRRVGNTDSPFNLSTNGMYYVVSFEDHQLWDTENDDRDYDSITGELGDLKTHIMKKFNEYAQQVDSFRFGRV